MALGALLLAVVCVLLLVTQILYVPPAARRYWIPPTDEAEAAEARLVIVFHALTERPRPSAASLGRQPVPPAAFTSLPGQLRLTQMDVNMWIAGEAPRYADKARNVRVDLGDGFGTISGIVEYGGLDVHVTARGRLARSADGALGIVVQNVKAGRVPLGQIVARRAERWVDAELAEYDFAGIAVAGVTMRPGEVIIDQPPPSE